MAIMMSPNISSVKELRSVRDIMTVVLHYTLLPSMVNLKSPNISSVKEPSAAFYGQLEVTKSLISQGAKANRGNNDGRTALHLAAKNGHHDVTTYLISQGAKVTKGNNDGWTALHLAAENGHLDVTKYLISQGAEVNKGDNDGISPLLFAAYNGRLDVTKYLISQGAEVNKGCNNGRTPLHHAVQDGNLEVVKVLLTGGARSDTGDIDGHTPLQFALFHGYRSIVDLLINHSNCKLKQNDLTGIHLAIQDGHTSTIKKLVSEGADLNVQSSDGQTCLHRAIKLSYKSGRIMHDTDTLKEISDEYYNGELSPEKALVFYLLENGAKLDVRDKKGNLPIHYAKDEVVKQMILSRLPSLEEIQSYRAEPSTPAIVSVEVVRNTSQEIELEDHGVSMFIPPGAVHQSDPCKITLTLLQDTPSVDIKDDESVACYGIRCDPPNMIFHQPVKIKIPHYALVMNPDQVKPNIVSRVLYPGMDVTITSRKRSSSSPHEPPYCKVYKRHLELYIGKCAEWWVLIPLEQQVIQHQLICTPYIPDNIERGQEFEVHLQMHADLPGMETDIRKEKQQQSYHKSHRSIPFSVESKSGDVTVTCHREGDQVDSKVLSLRDVCGKMRHNILLSVTPTDDDVKFTVITITITQAGRQEVSQSLDFIIRQTDGQEYLSPSEPLSFVGAVEEVLKSDLSDIDVLTIAQTMTVDQFYDLGVALGFTIQQLDVIEYRRFRDREQAIYDMLVTWRERQPSGQAAKETFLSLMESLDPPAEGIAITDIGLTGEIPDRTLLAFARQIRPEKFFEIGEKLGFNTSELQHIEHRILYNRKNANIQMLSSWKASQTSGPEAKQTLKLVWESVQDVSKAEKTKDSGKGIALLNTKTAGTFQALAEESDQGTAEAEKNDYDNLPEEAQSDGTDSVEPIDYALGLDFLEAAHEQGPSGGQTMTQEPTATTNQPLLDDKSSKNQGNLASGVMLIRQSHQGDRHQTDDKPN
ncbi:uncharacterized protein LOC763160 [Strongylocentrotus purpuratus]|uniref:ZU5 domain-containing protein n=1 Tax=Strongylocentrotus purpuratus TaxID=7668 RepID=A0A7M7T043_STRPU|nr:uncharacterized protein LOC763160 [Strongylocentrotus purpuratus]